MLAQPMKVLQVLYSGLGGHGSVVTSLINADTGGKWEHALLFYGIEDLLPGYKEFCSKKNIPYSFVRKSKGLLKSGSSEVRAAVRSHNPDVILLHSPNLVFTIWWYCLFTKKKFFVVEHTSNSIKGFPELLVSFFSLVLARKVVYLSSIYQQQLQKKFWFFPVKKKSLVIQNGIDLQTFKPVDKAEQSTMLHAGMIGRFILPKNQALIVDAVERGIQSGAFHQKVVIHFAGNGGSLADLQESVQKKGLQDHVKFHGLLTEEEIISFLEKLDFYVHASYAETMCTSVMQAMASGLPVVASNVPGINDIVIEKDNALLFDNTDINGLVQGLAMMQDTIARRKMGDNARQYADKKFSSVETFSKYNNLIKG
jgi:L-malate glycosyltransferase